MSSSLRDQIRREMYITNEIIIRQETARARQMCRSCSPEGGPDLPHSDEADEHYRMALLTPLTGADLDLVVMLRQKEEEERRLKAEEEERMRLSEAGTSDYDPTKL